MTNELGVVTVRQASNATGMSVSRIMRRIRAGKIKAEKIGWMWVIQLYEIERLQHEVWADQNNQQ